MTTTTIERRDDWRTPWAIFAPLQAEYGFTLDAAASTDNTLCPTYFDEQTNGLTSSWEKHRVWVNPPYADIGPWVRKAIDAADEDGVFSCLLLPASVDTAWWHLALRRAQVHLFRGRIAFVDPTGFGRSAPKQANCLVIVDPTSARVGVTAARCSRTGRILWRAA